MKIASFNVNSVRARLGAVSDWLSEHEPDLLCLQETKVQDADFPTAAFAEAGYKAAFRGQKSYNGVAILSREELADVAYGLEDGDEPDEPRLIRGRLGDVHVVNAYVPQGTATDSPRFQYKLEWFARVRRLFERHYQTTDQLVWVGDLNVAREPIDVYEPERLYGEVCYHPDEHRALAHVVDWGLVDVFRKHCPEPKQFTFFDYRVPAAPKRGLGWRIDHILATPALADRSTAAYIDMAPRLRPKPSDHTPIVAEFDV